MVSTVAAQGARGAVHQAIYNASSATGVDFNYLFNQARVESSLNPDAKARTSSATGLYQFIEQSWLGVVAKHGSEHGLGWAASAITRGSDGRHRVADPAMRRAILDLRRDPDASAAMAAEFAADNRDQLETRLGHTVESVDLYLAHFLGAGGATKFLRQLDANPDASAAAVFPAAARSNRAVFYNADGTPRRLTDVRSRFARKIESQTPLRGPGFVEQRFASPGLQPALDHRMTKPTTQARLAYLMLASLGVSA